MQVCGTFNFKNTFAPYFLICRDRERERERDRDKDRQTDRDRQRQRQRQRAFTWCSAT